MSDFYCEKCGAPSFEGPGGRYVAGCEHYPAEVQPPVNSPRYLDTSCFAPKFRRGDRVFKPKGSSWYGIVVGEYSTKLTPEGYAVESAEHPGSVQIYPAAALEHTDYEPPVRKS